MADITDTIARSRPEPGTLRTVDTDALIASAQRQTTMRRTAGVGLVTASAIGVAVALSGLSVPGLAGVDDVEPVADTQDAETRQGRQAEARRLFGSCAREHGFEVTDLQLRVTRSGIEVAGGGMMSNPHTDEPTAEEHAAAWVTCADEVAEAFSSERGG